jgi:hypothetical protein
VGVLVIEKVSIFIQNIKNDNITLRDHWHYYNFGSSNMFMQDILVVVDVHNLWLCAVGIVEYPLKKDIVLEFNNQE